MRIRTPHLRIVSAHARRAARAILCAVAVTASAASAAAAASMATIALVASAVAMAPAASAQSVTGVVRDSASAAPLPGVLVSVLGTDGVRVRAELTDDAGRFDIAVPMGRWTLGAERIGLRPATTEPFDLDALRPYRLDIDMSNRAVEIAGLVVDARVQSCRLDPEGAVRIQRWWQEIRTALDVSAVLQRQQFADFKVERFEREWGSDLRRIVASSRRQEVSTSSRPFSSEPADFLADGGFVQGVMNGQRQYYAPDADVLLSDVFLEGHCFALVEDDDRDDQLGLRFEPTGGRDVTEIVGTLWVDTTTAELQDMEFRYVRLTGVEEHEAGGRVGFDYLEGGLWIVSDWYIRMPKLGVRETEDGPEYELIGYVDVGAEVELLEQDRAPDVAGLEGAIRGVVYDSIRGAPLPDARVLILGTRFEATTDARGEFILTNVPVGEHNLSFLHTEVQAWGLGASFVEVDVRDRRTSDVRLAVPSFRQAARTLCAGEGIDAQAVLTGHLIGPDQQALARTPIEIGWMFDQGLDGARTRRLPATTGSDGRFLVCTVPAETEVSIRVRMGERWVAAAVLTLPTAEITYREIWITR